MTVKEATLKQKRFVDNYLRIGDGQNAIIATPGYTENPNGAKVTACRTLQRPPVKAYLEKRLTEVNKKLDISKEWRQGKLKRIVDEFVSNEKGVLDAREVKVAVSAIAEINKMEGDYAPSKTINAHLNVDADKEQLEQLLKLYEKEY